MDPRPIRTIEDCEATDPCLDPGVSAHVNYARQRRPYDDRIAQLVADLTPRDGRVLDLGCGVGHCLAAIRERRQDLRLVAADRDSLCLQRVRERRVADEIREYGVVEDLRDLEGVFAGVILSHVLEHTLSPSQILHEAMALLRPGGHLYAAVPNPVRPQMLLADLLRRKRVRTGHVYSWDRSHWMNFLEVILGLRVILHTQDYVPIPFTGHSRPIRALERGLSSLFPWFSFSHISVIAKGDVAPTQRG